MAQPLNLHRIANPSVQLHALHPPPSANRKGLSAAGVSLRRNRTNPAASLRDFCSGAYTRHEDGWIECCPKGLREALIHCPSCAKPPTHRVNRHPRAVAIIYSNINVLGVAGARGFEPRNAGIKIRCLTAWLRPNRALVGDFRDPRAAQSKPQGPPTATAGFQACGLGLGSRTVGATGRRAIIRTEP